MNVVPENIIVNSCEYTPVYLIPNTSVTQAGSYIITQSNQNAQKPVTDNLKTFYESSGNLESSLLSSPKPRILKKASNNIVGNNLKLASFLLPKSEVTTVQTKTLTPVTNVVVKPIVTPVTTVSTVTPVTTISPVSNVDPTVPRVEIDRKIVRVGHIPNRNTTRTQYPRVLPRKKPKEIIDPNPSKHTSVQLLKLGETYHSLNQLSDEQMKIVNKALKIFSDPEKIPKEPAYDPVTNTKFIYKVVSPRDLTVVGRNKVVVKKKTEIKKQKIEITEEPFIEKIPIEPKVTRSGRTVKLPKQMRPSESPQKPKKKVGSVVNCFQCSAEFCSFYRLQRHYEMYPTHIPARIHSNLFHCLLAIIKGGGEEDQANIFIQQLEQLIEKLKTLLPCLLKKIDGGDGKLCTINDDIGRLFGMNPGKYNLNMDALSCLKDKDGHCIHNPAPKNNQFNSDVSKPSQMWLSKHNEEVANHEAETEDCARINSVDKWPTVTKRNWKQRKQKFPMKKMRLVSENEQPIELGIDDVITFSKPNENSAIIVGKADTPETVIDSEDVIEEPIVEKSAVPIEDKSIKHKSHAQFHSAHFDIRSSPIKLPSSLVRKFQINPDKITHLEVQLLRPLASDIENDQHEATTEMPKLFKDNVVLPNENVINNELNFQTAKDWDLSSNQQQHNSFVKSNTLFESTLTPEKNESLIEPLMDMDPKGDCLFETPSKVIEENLLQVNDKPNTLIEPLLHVNDKTNGLFGSQVIHVKESGSNGFYPTSVHIQPKCNSLIGSSVIHTKDKSFETALSHVKNRSNNLFETSMVERNKPCNLEPLLHSKDDNDLFHTSLGDMKERANNLFESSLMYMKDKDVMIDPTLLLKDNSGLFNSSIAHQKDGLIEASLEHDDKSNDLIDQSLIHSKTDAQSSMNIDVNQSGNLSANDSRFLSSQGQSVLNFLESLGNESLGLAYPETEIRNNSVDFQLDLFSFNNS